MITVTESAVRMVRQIMSKAGQSAAVLRVGVKGGGCSGFSYHMEVEAAGRDGDTRFEFHGLPVVVDARSLELLKDITLDYHDGLNSGFEWTNPHATKTCSCGESFSV